MQSFRTLILAAFSVIALIGQAQAALITVSALPYPLPSAPGTGLFGRLWVDVDVNTLTAAAAYTGSHAADATFNSTTVDYPKGPAPTASAPGTDFLVFLGSDAGSLDPIIVGSHDIHNSIMLLDGFFRVATADVGVTQSFSIRSDDGSKLNLAEQEAIIINDGIHAFGGQTVDVVFTKPGLYDISILFFEAEPIEGGIEFAVDGEIVPTERLYSNRVPEPGSLALLGTALAGLAVAGTRRRNNL